MTSRRSLERVASRDWRRISKTRTALQQASSLCQRTQRARGAQCLGPALAGHGGETIGEIGDRARIHIRLVPLLDDAEIRGSGSPRLSTLPAIALQVIRRRGEHVRNAADEVPPAAIIDGEFDVGGGHELRLADLAGPGAAHLAGLKSPRSTSFSASISSARNISARRQS